MKLPDIYTLFGYKRVQSVVVIGCGGTGGYVVSHLTRLMYSMEESAPSLILVDGDKVEKKNLLRQHFIQSDIGRNKAEILAERYSAVFGLRINVFTNYIEDKTTLLNLFNAAHFGIESSSILFISCVDNNPSRKLLYEEIFSQHLRNSFGTFWIDAGNELASGQVVLGYKADNNSSYYYRPSEEYKSGVFSLPAVTELYDLEYENSKFNSQLSCAENANADPQNMMTNVTAANLVMNYTQKILLNEPIKSHAVEFSINNVFNTKLNTPENLSKINKNRITSYERNPYFYMKGCLK